MIHAYSMMDIVRLNGGSNLFSGTQTRRSVGGWSAILFYAGIDLSSILVTALRQCRVNGCVYCEPALT